MSRPSKAVVAIAKEIAKARPGREIGGFKGSKIMIIPISWKNRRVMDAAIMHDARQRIAANPEQYPNRMTRQQKRWLIRRGLMSPEARPS